ncbi:MAG: glutathione S-transferase family protein [Rhodospirillaceae bacterium]|nr:glutathione S-transferase family protein [Rhodospirillaceae bacterium]MYH36967.1 glutathione S-transferase family protein [Rhodospirillaceae bacterium]MYK12585.1 glutathione S-transferase family protein [Rhodospirillaceae bacterium]
MIDLYTWSTSNGRKASIMLEELGADYTLHPIHIGKGDQFTPEYLAINPNGKIPALVDSEGPGGAPITVFESGAILIYLAEKFGRFLPAEPVARMEVIQWLMFQMGGIGPIFGQVHHFLRAAKEKVPYGIERYGTEARRLYGVLDRRLDGRDHLAGDSYSIADIATWPWVLRHEWQQVDLADYPNVKRWFDAIGSRPAVQRGIQIPPPPQ